MAKAKKDTTPADASDAAAKAKKAPAKKAEAAPAAAASAAPPQAKSAAAPAKKAAPAGKGGKAATGPASRPLIDTNLAASTAASLVANRNLLGGAGTAAAAAAAAAASGEPPKESASFRQLKESLSKPGGSNLGGILGTGPTQQKKSQTHGPDKQVGRNQTFGADVNRSGVPRRTGG